MHKNVNVMIRVAAGGGGAGGGGLDEQQQGKMASNKPSSAADAARSRIHAKAILTRSRSLQYDDLKPKCPPQQPQPHPSLNRTDSVLSGHSSQAKDSGVCSENPSGVASDLPSCDIPSDLPSALLDDALDLDDECNECNQILSENRSTRKKGDDKEDAKQSTIRQHYYPEGGWGWIIVICGTLVQIITHGLHLSIGYFRVGALQRYGSDLIVQTGWLGAMSTAVALLLSPVTVAFCRRKSTRLTAVLGGLVTALGCLFTSFASQFHQLFFSYGTVVGIGVGLTRDTSTLMVGQYFKRRREFVEIFIVSGSGLGISVMSAFLKGAISSIGWRLGLQAVTGAVFLTFILGTCYRSASLYHPQRRAILHLKNQKRKVKDKSKVDDRPPFFDFSTLKSKTVRILLVSTGISAFGINTPIFYLAHQASQEGLEDSTLLLLQTYLGLAWAVGCCAFGVVVVQNSMECRIARQYLCQASVFMCGLAILAFTAVQGYHGYVMFVWIYGIFCGGYHYSLKMYTYEKVRARNFARAWGFVQCSQAIPIAIGVPISGYINVGCGEKAGYYFSSTCVLAGSMALFLIDVHRRKLQKQKESTASALVPPGTSPAEPPDERRLSFPEDDPRATSLALLQQRSFTYTNFLDLKKPELTCISEEGIADMDLPDNLLLEELELDLDYDYFGDCITSCNKVENYLMLSEYENNLIAELPVLLDRRGRRWSVARQASAANAIDEDIIEDLPAGQQNHSDEQHNTVSGGTGDEVVPAIARETHPSRFRNWRILSGARRGMAVIDEASV